MRGLMDVLFACFIALLVAGFAGGLGVVGCFVYIEVKDRSMFMDACLANKPPDVCVYDWRRSQAVEVRGISGADIK